MLQWPSDVSPSGEGPHVNKFEQVSSNGHQMSLGVRGSHIWGGDLYSEVQIIIGNGHMGPPIDKLTDTHI